MNSRLPLITGSSGSGACRCIAAVPDRCYIVDNVLPSGATIPGSQCPQQSSLLSTGV
ncbi:hypothetical protein GYMLUDRAFT_76145 [Collybiopsis luxurians FD-317 M1]|uniref:Uncharacterized protein n=1 Tax=Collybiopsis luxurians FD-317 M1 TaxID=944289 RepID=A0A0D0CEB9_9AGAR|nr:hypothetical protein GYMLUDRAFT_76145 [Collybiopsis luxurians FD-317 M1]